jgi:cytidylate kinase
MNFLAPQLGKCPDFYNEHMRNHEPARDIMNICTLCQPQNSGGTGALQLNGYLPDVAPRSMAKRFQAGRNKKEIQAGKMFHILIAFNSVDTAGPACGRRVALNQEDPITKRFDNDREGMMSIITISRGSYGYGSGIAEKLAQKLGYDCVSRKVLLDASETFNIPEIKLVKAIENPPSFIERLSLGKEKYIAYIRSAFMKSIATDNVVYHGFAGHFFVRDIPHVCKIRINADMKYRIRKVMKNENVSAGNAEKMIGKIDDARRKWSLHLYGMDTSDADLYDMVFKIDNMNEDNVVDIIANTVQLPCFQISPKAREAIDNKSLEYEIKANLVEQFPMTRHVSAKAGTVTVMMETALKNKEKVEADLEKILRGVDGVKTIDVCFKH